MSLILLAGGKSSRLNSDKAFIKLFWDKTIIENIIDSLKDIFNEIIIVANNIEKYKLLGFKVNQDIVRNKGPLGGIYTGLKVSKEENNFVLACDMPFINVDLIRYLLKFDSYDAVVPRVDNHIEPLHAIYSKKVLPIIETQIRNNELKVSEAVKKIKRVKYIEKEEIQKFDREKLSFFNINDKNDLERAMRL